jgi:protein-tyrosine-phosphatase
VRFDKVKKRLVFICLGNSCRSIMAEALARHLWGDSIEVASAGINPLGHITGETLEVLSECGVSTAGLRSKGLSEISLDECRMVVNLTGYSLESRLPPGFSGQVLNRPVADPYGGSLALYRQTRDDLKRLISEELAPLLISS